MKLRIIKDKSFAEPCVTIEYSEESKQINDLIEMVRLCDSSIQAEYDGSSLSLALKDIYYFESVDDKSFIYTKDRIYNTTYKLYKIEEMVCSSSFVRISKSCIVNIQKMQSVKPFMNGRFEATMRNGEKLIINRHYVSDFKKKFGI